jgi:hypothetical protein
MGSQAGTGPGTTDRFVKWINRRNVRKQFRRHEISKTTSQCLYGSPQHTGIHPNVPKPSDNDLPSPSASLMDVHDDYTDHGMDEDSVYAVDSRNKRRSVKQPERWEFIPNASQMDLCMVLSNWDENPSEPMGYKVVLVPSADEKGIETTIHSTSTVTCSYEDPMAAPYSFRQFATHSSTPMTSGEVT